MTQTWYLKSRHVLIKYMLWLFAITLTRYVENAVNHCSIHDIVKGQHRIKISHSWNTLKGHNVILGTVSVRITKPSASKLPCARSVFGLNEAASAGLSCCLHYPWKLPGAWSEKGATRWRGHEKGTKGLKLCWCSPGARSDWRSTGRWWGRRKVWKRQGRGDPGASRRKEMEKQKGFVRFSRGKRQWWW